MIRILYFASLRYRLECDREELELPARVSDVQGLASFLAARGDVWGEIFDSDVTVLSAINQEMARPESPISDGDEIGFFPPVTGG